MKDDHKTKAELLEPLRRRIAKLERSVSRSKRAEDAARASEARLRNLIETTSDWIWEVDENAFYTYASPKIRDLLGYEPEEVLGKTPFDLMPPEEARRVAAIFGRIAASRQRFASLENVNLHKDGHAVVLETSGVPIFGEEGTFRGYRGIDRDITERKGAKEALKESEDRCAKAERIGSFGHWERDLVNGSALWSREVYRIYGLDPERTDTSLEGFLSLVHPSDRPGLVQAMKSAVETGKRPDVEYRVARPDGTERVVQCIGEVLRGENGEVVKIVGTIHDITERKRAEEALRESEEKWRSLAENAPNFIAIVDRDGRLQYINRTVSGLTVEDTIGRKVYEYIAPAFHDVARNAIEQVFRTDGPASYETLATGPEGRDSWYETQVGAIKRGGQVVAATLISTDITDRKRAEETLRHERDNLYRILDGMEDGVYIINDGHDVEYVNPAVRREFGPYGGKKCFDYFHGRTEVCPDCKNEPVLAGRTVRWERCFTRNQKTYDVVDTPLRNAEGSVSKLGILRDITDRKRAEQALRRERDNLLRILDGMEDGVCIIDAAYDVKYTNPALRRQLGPHEGKKCFDYFYGRAEACMDCRNQEVLSGERVRWEWHSPRDQKTYDVINTPLRNPDGSVSKLGILRDVTEHKRLDDALRESEAKYHHLVENTNDIVFAADAKGCLTYVSPQGERFGISPEDSVGRSAFDFILPEDREAVARDFRRTMATGEEFPTEFRMRDKDGGVHWLEDVSRAQRDESGRIAGIAGVLRDITERKRAEEALRESEKKYRELVENVNDVIYVLDEKGIVTYVSPAVESLIGYKPCEVIGRPFSEFAHPEDLPQMKESFREILSGRPRASERRVLTRSGEARWVRASSQAIVEEDQVVGLRGILVDMTGEKSLEDRILEASAREQRRIGRDLHDGLGQELAGIAYLCKSLEQQLASKSLDDAAEAAEIARLIDEAVVDSRGMVKALNPVRPEPDGLAQALDEMASNVSGTYGVSCAFRSVGRVLVNNHGDAATHAFRIAQEAVSNAMKHGRARRITMELQEKEDRIILTVRDDGTGLTEGWWESQGMGLRTMEDRARIIGGSLSVRAAVEGGTVVTCRFPRGPRQA